MKWSMDEFLTRQASVAYRVANGTASDSDLITHSINMDFFFSEKDKERLPLLSAAQIDAAVARIAARRH